MTDTTYATVTQLKARVQIVSSDASRDVVLQASLNAAASTIDMFCNRPDGFVAVATATARVFPGSGAAIQWIDECVAITLVAVKDSPTSSTYTSWTTADWLAFAGDPDDPEFNRVPYTALMTTLDGSYSVFTNGLVAARGGFSPLNPSVRRLPTVQVTAKWGYAVTVPPQITEATIAQAARWFLRGRSSWGDAVANEAFGTILFKKALDPDIEQMLSRFIKPTVG